ncbi:hypothetical protein YQE_06941, partial [Dendroctonus ponderosae]
MSELIANVFSLMDNSRANSMDKASQVKQICASLQSNDKFIRRKCFLDLKKFLNSPLAEQELRDIFTQTHVYFLNGLRDPSEAVREEAVQFVAFLILDKYPLSDFYLTYVFPILVERIGSPELVEESEEIRLSMLALLNKIIFKYSNCEELRPFLNDCVSILAETIKDKYPSIKDLSCRTIISLSKALPKDFHMQAQTLLKPVLSCFSHQRFKIRVEAIHAVGEIVMHCTGDGLNEAVIPMAQKLFDQVPAVRQAVAEVAGYWLLNHRDRYSYFQKMLPLLLTGLCDEVEATRIQAHALWQKVGQQFQQESEKDFKDILDFLTDTPCGYPTHLQRPSLGCRVLVQRNIDKIAGAVSNELLSWQEDVRVRCSQLLCSLVLHGENKYNPQSLLPAMYSAATDDDKRVVENIVEASKIIGYVFVQSLFNPNAAYVLFSVFVTYETWSKLIIPVIENECHFGPLKVLAGLITGAPKSEISKGLETLSQVLSEDQICCSRKKHFQLALLECVRALMSKYDIQRTDTDEETLEANMGYSLFKIVTSLIALAHPDNLNIINSQLYSELHAALGTSKTPQELFANQLFMHINCAPKLWTLASDNACIFLTLLRYCGSGFSASMEVIGDILIEVLDTDSDAELRLKTFYLLADLFSQKEALFSQAENVNPFMEKLVLGVFVPSLIWHAGAIAQSIRTIAVTCLSYAIAPVKGINLFNSSADLKPLVEKLIPLLLSLLEDASQESRKKSIECLTLIKKNCVEKDIWSNDDLISIYPEVLKRLDDPNRAVRIAALICLEKLFVNVPEEFRNDTYKAHRELILATATIHFQDHDEDVRINAFSRKLITRRSKILVQTYQFHT